LAFHSAVETREQTEWSLMPDNISAGLTRQDIADLLAYLQGSSHTGAKP